ncbi:MAG TPA: J domain-containing protein [Kofleriaceae bacterium]|nr:J domain-containing protein [Kofleriaceae bacterium]
MRNGASTGSPSSPPSSAERLARGDFVRLVYRLARTHATGVLTIFPGPHVASGTGVRAAGRVLVLRRGHLMAADAEAGSRATAQRLERLAALDSARFYFDGGVAAYPPGALLRQYNLAAWARSHLESQLDAARAHAMMSELAGIRLALRPELAPELGWCDDTDRRILAAMAVPRRLDQIGALARTARFRLLSFLYFLRAVGAVSLGGVAAPSLAPRSHDDEAWRLLGVPAGADRETVKRAYRRLARALHPDMHGGSSDERRRQLERKLADVNCAYRRLVDAASV